MSCTEDDLNFSDGASVGLITDTLSSHCTKLQFFLDANNNGALDEDENIVNEFEVCNGSNGSSIGLSTIESTSEECANNGYKHTFFLDNNSNGTQDEGERVLSSIITCNGLDGYSVGVDILSVDRSICEDGGWLINLFVDSNKNGLFDDGEEIISSKTNCFPDEIDSDNDGVPDSYDNCPLTEQDAEVNAFGCALYQLDSDGDGISDDLDNCPNTESGTSVNAEGCNSDEYNAIEYSFTNLLINDISFENASISVEISQSKGETQEILEAGFRYNILNASEQVIQGAILDNRITLDQFSDPLKLNTTYQITPYVKNQFGTYYGEASNFSTLDSRYIFTNTLADDISFTTAIISSDFEHINDEKVDILEKGFYLSDNETDLNNYPNVVDIDDLSFSLDALTTGTKYYFQFYVKTKYNESRSEVVSFSTVSDIPVFEFEGVSSTYTTIDASFRIKSKSSPLKVELELLDKDGNTDRYNYEGSQLGSTVDVAGAIIAFGLTDLKPNTAYSYSLLLTTSYGTYQSSLYGYSTKDDAPNISLSVTKSGDNSFDLATSYNTPEGVPIERAILEYKHQEEVDYSFIELDPSGERVTINNLTQGPQYEFKLTVTNKYNDYELSKFDNLPVTYTVGDELFGGIIAYIDHTGYHGIVIAKIEGLRTLQWSTDNQLETNISLVDKGDINTQNIVQFYATSNESAPAAEYCDNYSANGYSDWFLPSKSDLLLGNRAIHQMLVDKYRGSILSSYNWLWASNLSESKPSFAVYIYYNGSGNGISGYDKEGELGVVPIRYF